jgi:hypothetical protein
MDQYNLQTRLKRHVSIAGETYGPKELTGTVATTMTFAIENASVTMLCYLGIGGGREDELKRYR